MASASASVQKTVQLHEGQDTTEVAFEASHPSLWSHETPYLYQLRCSIEVAGAEDNWEQRIGFRQVAIDGTQFLLNGKNLVLQGVCRHDVWKDQGLR
jgi:beta-galactosidase